MSSTSLNTNLYEIIGRLTVWTQSLESDISALRAELSENATYIASLESRLQEFTRNPPSASAAAGGAQRPKLSHRCNRHEAYNYGRIGAFGNIVGGAVPQHEDSYGVPERQVADGCSSCGISVSKGNHDTCHYNPPPLVRQVADGCASCGISLYEGNHDNCAFTPLVRQVADNRWHHEHQPSLFRENEFERYANEHEEEIAEEKIVAPPDRRLTLSDLAIPSHIVDGLRRG